MNVPECPSPTKTTLLYMLAKRLLLEKFCCYGYHVCCLCYRKDAFTGAEYIQEGLQIEQASVLYNLCEWMSLHGGERGREGGRKEERERREGLNHVQSTQNYLNEGARVSGSCDSGG